MSRLYIIPTPIGNLEDVTLRAVRLLQEVDLILAEDTRTSGVFLKHYSIRTLMRSHHAFNEHAQLDQIIALLKNGSSIALISDAGTPGISDPGFLLVRACIAENIPVETLPGATAFVPALINSGLPADSFLFVGFLPVKKGRETKLKSLSVEKYTLILYESPHRLVKTLQQLLEHFGDRQISISRELSKKFEETVRGNISHCITHFQSHAPKGEFVLVVAGST
ncbi:MAG: 16S rRNA (cytidine(1402)-2'-O)-methyltransferase [Chitinophagales bacterium]